MQRYYLYLIVTLASILIALDLATFAAPIHRVADGLTGYRAQYLASGALLLALLLRISRHGLVRACRWGLALVICHQLYWILPTLKIPDHSQSQTSQHDEIHFSVGAFNVLHSNRETDNVIDYFEIRDPDIIAFFESIKHWPEALQSLNHQWPHRLRIEALDMELHSKHPISSHQTFRFG